MFVCPQGIGEGVCLQGGQHPGESASGGGAASGGGVCLQGGVCIGGIRQTPPRTRKTGGMHPTGMLSCIMINFDQHFKEECPGDCIGRYQGVKNHFGGSIWSGVE